MMDNNKRPAGDWQAIGAAHLHHWRSAVSFIIHHPVRSAELLQDHVLVSCSGLQPLFEALVSGVPAGLGG